LSDSNQDRDDAFEDTRSEAYTARLDELGGASWKRYLDVQAPYRWNIRRLDLGFTLDIGCGIGRNLLHLDGRGVGVDHNESSVEMARARGCTAYTTEAFEGSEYDQPERFDSLLLAHVVEHMRHEEAVELVKSRLGLIRPGGRVVLIAPQDAGYRSDATHVEFMDLEALRTLLTAAGLEFERGYSFPFPRFVGRIFLHNEFVALGKKPIT
jgi:2-polyprenyl-3-methyl-5-hydroxy-6-metoxy-1,4-benzoquinol methylase